MLFDWNKMSIRTESTTTQQLTAIDHDDYLTLAHIFNATVDRPLHDRAALRCMVWRFLAAPERYGVSLGGRRPNSHRVNEVLAALRAVAYTPTEARRA